jgi:hypothetical protein
LLTFFLTSNRVKMEKYTWIFCIVTILLIFWIYYIQFSTVKTEHSIFIDDLARGCILKTGDIILFKAYNNVYSIFHGSYFGHIGIVYIMNGIPMLFEANGIENTPLKEHHSKKGVFLTPLAERVKKYKGKCFWKPLNQPITNGQIDDLKDFIDYSMHNMEYDYAVISGGIKRMIGLAKCGHGTDCGQIVFLSLIKMGLIPVDEYDKPMRHHLRYTCEITELQNGYRYLPLVEIIDHPFAE